MSPDIIPGLIRQVDSQRLSNNLLCLCKDPLPYRKVNYTLPGHSKSTLDEADDFIAGQLEGWGYAVEREPVQVQAVRRDISKPKAAQYSAPEPDDPWYTAYNLYARKTGNQYPDEIIVVVSHKDSQSWIDSPGAYDNVGGTIANIEIARILSDYTPQRSLCFLFCNEEHKPWTSITAAQNAKERGDNIIAVFNVDGVGGKSQEYSDLGKKPNVTLYTEPEGKPLAELMAQVNEEYGIGLEQTIKQRECPGDDDGSFVNAGYPAAVVNTGSFPYADPNYHAETDVAELVDIENVAMATQATLAAIVRVDDGQV